MSKILRKAAKIFGFNAGANEIAEYGSLAAGSPVFSNNPDDIQSLSQYDEGWFSAVIGNNSPAMEDMNALQFLKSYQIAYLHQAGISEWNSGTIYYVGSFVNVDGVIYISLSDDNTGNLVSDPYNWKLYRDLQMKSALQNMATRELTPRAQAINKAWTGVCRSDELNLFVAVAANAGATVGLMTSPDGIFWNSETIPVNFSFMTSVAWSGTVGRFVAVANANAGAGQVLTSTNGSTWAASNTGAPGTPSWSSVIWCEALGFYFACSSNGLIYKSATGNSGWASSYSNAPVWFSQIIYSPEKSILVAVSLTGETVTSPDGITWTLNSTFTGIVLKSVTYAPELGIFIAIGHSSFGVGFPMSLISTDALTWGNNGTIIPPSTTGYYSITWSSQLQLFMATCGSSNKYGCVITSPDSFVWTKRRVAETGDYTCVIWSETLSMFLGVAANGFSGTYNVFTSK